MALNGCGVESGLQSVDRYPPTAAAGEGAESRCPALNQLRADARHRRFDVLVVWRLDRLERNLRHLITLLEELQALGIAFVTLNEGTDATTPANRATHAKLAIWPVSSAKSKLPVPPSGPPSPSTDRVKSAGSICHQTIVERLLSIRRIT